MPKKKEVVKEVPVEPVEPEEPDVACPVCGKPVSMEVNSCPHCGAEFEEETEEVEETPAKAVPVDEEETAECPVCGKSVSLAVSSCPYCGAEFEEGEVEEVLEVEEREVQVKAAPLPPPKPRKVPEEVPILEAEEEYVEDEAVVEEATEEEPVPASITDFRVIGVALIVLGIIGSQIAFMIDWYWTWVPPIESHLGTFVAIPAVIIVVGLLVFMLVKKMSTDGKSFPKMMPGMSLSVFMFGILALILIMLWSPINNALQDSKVGVGGAFVAVLVVGVLVMFMGQKMAAKSAA